MMPIRYGKVVGKIITVRGDGTDTARSVGRRIAPAGAMMTELGSTSIR